MTRQLRLDEIESVVTKVMTRAMAADPARLMDAVNVPYAAKEFAKGNCQVWGWFDQSDEPHGILVGVVTPDILTGILTGYEYLWMVEPRWRMTRVPLQLLTAFMQECKRLGCGRFVAGLRAEVHLDRMRGLYEKLGFEKESETYTTIL